MLIVSRQDRRSPRIRASRVSRKDANESGPTATSNCTSSFQNRQGDAKSAAGSGPRAICRARLVPPFDRDAGRLVVRPAEWRPYVRADRTRPARRHFVSEHATWYEPVELRYLRSSVRRFSRTFGNDFHFIDIGCGRGGPASTRQAFSGRSSASISPRRWLRAPQAMRVPFETGAVAKSGSASQTRRTIACRAGARRYSSTIPSMKRSCRSSFRTMPMC